MRKSWEEYGISIERYVELKSMCAEEKYSNIAEDAARETAEKVKADIADYILLSVRENKSFDRMDIPKYWDKFGRICVGRTDFYSYRRLFYHIFDKKVRENI